MQLTGIIIAVLDVQSGVSQSGKNWARQEFVLETEERYPKRCLFHLFGEDRIKTAALAKNMRVTVDFDIDAREYQGRWYNNVSAWKVTNLDAPQMAQPKEDPTEQYRYGNVTNPTGGYSSPPLQPQADNRDGLPF